MEFRSKSTHFTRRLVAVIAGLAVCLWLIKSAATVGASRLLSNYGTGSGLVAAVDKAVSINANDSEAYAARASVFLNAGEAALAAADFEQAVKLRPSDYLLWMQLGHARDQADDIAGAIAALKESTRLAPYYAHTHWQFGNLLLRAGRYEEAFAELRRAAASQPSLAPQMIDLTWGVYSGNAAAVEAIVQPQSSSARIALAIYFAQRGKADEAINLFRQSRNYFDKENQALLTALLDTGKFSQAHEVWESGHEELKAASGDHLIDGSFEGEINLDNPGFGWQIKSEAQAMEISLDSREPSGGLRSLLIIWNGNPQPATAIVSQLVMVTPHTRYQLSFDTRARELVTAAPPVIIVVDANAQEKKFAQAAPFSEGTTGWQKSSISFETGETTRAVRIIIRRQSCAMPICPIFGRTWFDNFILR